MKLLFNFIGIFITFLMIISVHHNHPAGQLLFQRYRQRPQPEQFHHDFGNMPRELLAQKGSFSTADNQAQSHGIGIGDQFGLQSSRTNSKTVTNSNGGFRNGGSTNIAKNDAITNNLNIGELGISSTVNKSMSISNGQISRAIGHDLNIGGLKFGASLSKDNLRNIGFQRDSNGNMALGLGLLKLDLSRDINPKQMMRASVASVANATGELSNAEANASSNKQQFGILDLFSSQSNARSMGIAKNGQTTANINGGLNAPILQNNNNNNSGSVNGPNLWKNSFLGRKRRNTDCIRSSTAQPGNKNVSTFEFLAKFRNHEQQSAKITINSKNTDEIQSRTFGAIFGPVMNMFGGSNNNNNSSHCCGSGPPYHDQLLAKHNWPPIHPLPLPLPYPPHPHPYTYHHPPIRPHIPPPPPPLPPPLPPGRCCYSCHRPIIHPNCQIFSPFGYGGGYGFGNYGAYGGYGAGAFSPYNYASATSPNFPNTPGTAASSSSLFYSIGPFTYSSASANSGSSLLSLLFGK